MSVITFYVKCPSLADMQALCHLQKSFTTLAIGFLQQISPNPLQCILQLKNCFALWLQLTVSFQRSSQT